MARLKDYLAADLNKVFFNKDEFAADHEINGETMACVVDEDISKQRGNRESENFDGVFFRQITLFVSEELLGYRPERDQKMTVDGEWFIVIDCAASAGMLEIELEANRT